MSSSLNTVNEERNQSLEDALKSPEAFMVYILNGSQYLSCAKNWPVYKESMLEMLSHQEVFLKYASNDFICELVRLYPHVREKVTLYNLDELIALTKDFPQDKKKPLALATYSTRVFKYMIKDAATLVTLCQLLPEYEKEIIDRLLFLPELYNQFYGQENENSLYQLIRCLSFETASTLITRVLSQLERYHQPNGNEFKKEFPQFEAIFRRNIAIKKRDTGVYNPSYYSSLLSPSTFSSQSTGSGSPSFFKNSIEAGSLSKKEEPNRSPSPTNGMC